MSANYRLDAVTIEGFIGFTTPQTIAFSGKSTFIFGQNGWGKSSILEAISWCLWGRDKDDEKLEIRNTDYYTGDCKVELVLIRGTERIRVTRKLSSTTGESDPWVTRDDGKRQNITEVLPQIRKLGGKGARVLFSQQGVTLRWGGDLDRFKDVIDAYLKLDRLEKMRGILREVSSNAKEAYDKDLKKQWKDLEGEINNLSQKISSKIAELLKEPPWDDPNPPTKIQVSDRIKALYADVRKFGGLQPIEEALLPSEPRVIINEIEKLIKDDTVINESTTILNGKKQILATLQGLRNKWSKLIDDYKTFSIGLAEAETRFTNAGGLDEINQLNSNLIRFAEEEILLSSQLGTARAKHEEAKRRLIIEQPALNIKAYLIRQKIERINTLEQSICEAKVNLHSIANDIELGALESELNSKKLKLSQQEAYANLLWVLDDYCTRFNCDICPICGVRLDSNSKVHLVKQDAARQRDEAGCQVKNLQDHIDKIRGIITNLAILNQEKQKLLETDTDPSLNLKTVLDRVDTLEKDVQLAEKMEIETEQKYSESRSRIQELMEKTKASLANLNSLNKQCAEFRQDIERAQVELENVKADVANQIAQPIDQTELPVLQTTIDQVNADLIQIGNDLDNKGAIVKTYKDRLANLRRALKFHDLLKLQAELADLKLGENWTKVEKSLFIYSSFLDNISQIIESLEHAYGKAFDNNVQAVNNAVQNVYKKLTAQQSYPDARVRRDQKSNEIIMEVGIAGRDIWRQNDVLNEQSRHAVALVPYFAFSELGMLNHDLDFLLIDDPSQSFDTKHLDELISLLHSASNYAQIVLATHEIEKFDPRIRNKFGQSACLLMVSGFNPNNGPTIVEI